jgi:nitroimidazol reductase NimA-like FMN-containing flavoprotein (pyridoxamine 5'-phosphate oxidase superfamily)
MGEPRITSGPWDMAAILDFLGSRRIPMRLASNGSAGPLVQSLWYLVDNGSLWCATQETSLLTQRITRDARVGFEIAGDQPPYKGVRGTGTAHIHRHDAERVLPALIERYQGAERTHLSEWLLSRLDREVAIRIAPSTFTSWDYSGRMQRP